MAYNLGVRSMCKLVRLHIGAIAMRNKEDT